MPLASAFFHLAYLCFVFNEVSEPVENFVIGDGWGKGKTVLWSEASGLIMGCHESPQTSHPGSSYPLASQDHLHLTGTPTGRKGWLNPFPNRSVAHCALTCYKIRKRIPKKILSDQALLIRQPKKPGLELISHWTVKINFVQGVLTFLRIIKDQVVTFHKGPTTEWMVSLVFPNA